MIPHPRNHPGPTFAFVASGDKGSGGPYARSFPGDASSGKASKQMARGHLIRDPGGRRGGKGSRNAWMNAPRAVISVSFGVCRGEWG